jgi:hypothetical protein
MTSRERVLAAIDHRQPDSVPVDLGATPIAAMPENGAFFDQTYFPYVDGYPDS